ncbi:MAG: nucleotidyltransferase domain-containing protein [Candidatus Doudnabacteria bacterium]|nr:nucleotidyltransferase domain-containing protein [Candidatus Doudnabacteria bacterium]
MTKKEQIDKAIKIIKQLENYSEYEAAFIFGSVARGDITENSDLDVRVITVADNSYIDVTHPFIEGVKLDLSFLSHEQLVKQTSEEENKTPQRVTWVGESLIIFDKTGLLTKLREYYKDREPKKLEEKSYPFQRFLIYNANSKVERNLKEDPVTAILSMNFGIKDLLQIHYAVHGRWWLSDKRLLADLDKWDSNLSNLVRGFIVTSDVNKKFNIWSQIVDYIYEPVGGRIDISKHENLSPVSEQGIKDISSLI